MKLHHLSVYTYIYIHICIYVYILWQSMASMCILKIRLYIPEGTWPHESTTMYVKAKITILRGG